MKDKIFDSVVENAIDFLFNAIANFESNPKYSIISFCSGVELVLKARLIKEHWSLIVEKDPDYNKFLSGMSKTLSFNELVPRILKVTQTTIHADAQKSFVKVANHRNKVIHFYHKATTTSASDEAKQDLAIEQLTAWWYLQELIGKWEIIFGKYKDEFDKINEEIHKLKQYLEVKFTQLKPDIERRRKEGSVIESCNRCSSVSSVLNPITEYLFAANCLVCNIKYYNVKFECSNCCNVINFDDRFSGELVCPKCEEQIDIDFLRSELDTECWDKEVGPTSIYCSFCDTEDAVVEHHEYYICLNCFEVVNRAQRCGWCGQLQIGNDDLETSYHTGCDSYFCEGLIGHTKDD